MEKFLACHPNIFPMRDMYQIVINLQARGVVRLQVGDVTVDEPNSGMFRTETLVHKFILPQSLLDESEEYTVLFYPVIERKPYFSTMGEEERAVYRFFPVKKTDGIRAVYIADVHCHYSKAEEVVASCGEADFYIVNGDLGEIDSDDSLRAMNTFMGNISRGERPVVVGRGNHDTRGLLAERLPVHIATDREERTYFPFTLGPISGIMLDCGEDKWDNHPEYGGYNIFEPWRVREAEEIAAITPADRPYRIAVCHIPFMMERGGGDIQREVYTSMTRSLEKMNIDMMLSGHMHWFDYLPKGGCEKSRYAHDFPVIVASKLGEGGWGCTLITFHPDRTEFVRADETGFGTDRFTVER